ncbi:MAG: hypothetical protein ACKVT0_05015 [Planctomycetaceae bacterium]
MSITETWIRKYQRRIAYGHFLKRMIEGLAIYLIVAGVSVLLMKLGGPRFWFYAPALLAGIIPVIAYAAWRFRSDAHSFRESVALLDRQIEAGGLLMMLCETSDPRCHDNPGHDNQWHDKLPQDDKYWQAQIPRLSFGRMLRPCRLPALFVIGACFLPLRPEPETKLLAGTVGETASQELDEILEVVKEISPLEEQEEQEIKQAIDELREETEQQPLTHEKWETIDSLSDRMRLKIEAHSAAVSKGQSALKSLAGADAGVTLSKSDQKQQQDMEDAAIETLQKAASKKTESGKFGNLSEQSKSQLQKLLKDGKFSSDPAERQKQIDALDDFLKNEAKKLAEAREKCKACKDGQCKDGQCSSCGKKLASGKCSTCNKPGNGGVTRGRGDAELSYGDESDEQGTKFKEIALPPGYLDEQSDQVSKITLTAPNETPADSVTRQAPRAFEGETGREVWKRPLSPRHRQVVKGYFSKPNTKKETE